MGSNEAKWNELLAEQGDDARADAALSKALADYPYKLDGFADQEWNDVFGMAIDNYTSVAVNQ